MFTLTLYICRLLRFRYIKFLIIRPIAFSIEHKWVLEQTCCLSYLLICPVGEMSKTAHWIWMPFGVVNRVSRGMGVLEGVEIVEGEGAVL